MRKEAFYGKLCCFVGFMGERVITEFVKDLGIL